MPKSPRMTLDDVLEDMRANGMKIGKDVLSNCLKLGIFPFGHVVSVSANGQSTFLIMRKDYDDWAKEYLQAYTDT